MRRHHNVAMVRGPQPSFNHLQRFARRGLLTLLVSLVVGGVMGWWRGHVGLGLLDAVCVGLGCWLCVDTGRMALARWRWQRMGFATDAPEPAPDGSFSYWPGWRWMSVCVVLGTLLGVLGGVTLSRLLAHGLGWLDEASVGASHERLMEGLAVLLGSLGVSLAVSYVFYTREQVALSLRQAEEARRVAAESQLRLLQAQLEPHMLFNTLANLRVLIQLDAQQAQAMLDRLISFLRATLSASRMSAHSLSDEFERVADYLALMQVRMGPRLRTQLILPEALRDCMVPPLLLQPLVENAIQHGLEPKLEGGELRVEARWQDEALRILVIDSGLGLRQDATSAMQPAVSKGRGFGLRQVRDRLAVTWGESASLNLHDARAGGTVATLILPCPDPSATP